MRPMKTLCFALTAVALGAVLLLSGCATPTETGVGLLADSALKDAEAAGARQYASSEFSKAEKKMQQARALRPQREFEKANRLEAEVQVDAQLAELQARSVKAEATMDQLREEMRTIRQELERMGNS